MNIKKYRNIFFQLIKINVTIPVTFLSFAGYVIASGTIDIQAIICCIGVFLLAGAASLVNQIVEIDFDRQMPRTAKRPMPSGAISLTHAWLLASVLTITGSVLLISVNWLCLVLGVVNLLWYLFVYTLLKRKTALAILPGSITGAMPFLIGWVAANGNIFEPSAILISAFIFFWQIPHFWLLMMIYAQDYRLAGYPVIQEVFTDNQCRLWTLSWIVATCLASMVLVYFVGVNNSSYYTIVLVVLNILLIWQSVKILLVEKEIKSYKKLFHTINLFMLMILLLLMIEKS